MNLQQILNSDNLVNHLTNIKLDEIAALCKEHYDTDRQSRSAWEKMYSKWLDMTLQTVEHKTKPWPGAANIKYPLMTQAALQFNARALPALIPNNEPVGAGKIGPDPTGEKRAIADKVAAHMNYQVTTEMTEWEEDFDSLLVALPVSGLEYKKTYYDSGKGRNVSKHVTPLKLVVNYYADSLETARKTEIHEWNKNKIMEGVQSGAFAKVDWEKQGTPAAGKLTDAEVDGGERGGRDEPSKTDSATPYVVLEYHGWLDLDDDGYEEPYIVTFMEDSLQILQIVPRFDEKRIQVNEEGNLILIEPYESYTKFGLVPNPDGSFYDIGFGNLLYPINAVVNTTINMMLDAGASSIMNSGFVGRGIKMRGGMFTMAPNTWMSVNTAGDDIRKNFVPMPTKEPSNVLYQLMMYMVESGQKVSGTTDIFTGEMPGQNTKAGVTQAVREEGQKVFTAIHKRLRRSLKKELDLLYELNGIVLAAGMAAEGTRIAQSARIFEVNAEMYSKELMNIQPSADPNIAIKEQRLQKDMTVYQSTMQDGIGNLVEAKRRVLRTMEVENLEAILPEDTQPPSDPKAQMEASLADFDAQMRRDEFDLEVHKVNKELELEYLRIAMQSDKNAADFGIQVADMEFKVDNAKEARVDGQSRDAASAANTGSMG